MKILICGGGTAGHVYPGLALAEALKSINRDIEAIFVGSERGLEAGVVPDAGFALETLPVTGLPRRPSVDTLTFAGHLGLSILRSAGLLKKYRPAVVVGMGGFASFPVVMLAERLGYPTLIHEQNAVLGLANRWLSRHADTVALTFPAGDRLLKSAKNVKVVGNPVRANVLKAKRRAALNELGLDDRQITILVFGGSRGARKINEAVIQAYDVFRHAHNLQIVHITGMMEYEQVGQRLAAVRQGHDKVKYHVFPYLKDMGLAYAVADLVVSRSGASTISEVTARGLPSILIPYPYATDNHQVANAKWLETAGAAKVITDENFSSQLFWQAVSGFVYHPAGLEEMAQRSARLGRPRAAMDLARLVLAAAGEPVGQGRAAAAQDENQPSQRADIGNV